MPHYSHIHRLNKMTLKPGLWAFCRNRSAYFTCPGGSMGCHLVRRERVIWGRRIPFRRRPSDRSDWQSLGALSPCQWLSSLAHSTSSLQSTRYNHHVDHSYHTYHTHLAGEQSVTMSSMYCLCHAAVKTRTYQTVPQPESLVHALTLTWLASSFTTSYSTNITQMKTNYISQATDYVHETEHRTELVHVWPTGQTLKTAFYRTTIIQQQTIGPKCGWLGIREQTHRVGDGSEGGWEWLPEWWTGSWRVNTGQDRWQTAHSSRPEPAGSVGQCYNTNTHSSNTSVNFIMLTLWRPLFPYGYKASCARIS